MTSADDRWLADAIATGQLDRAKPNMPAAGDRVNVARKHVVSARMVAENDPTLGISVCHDATRKAITAHMAAKGVRPRSGEGAHRIVLEYAREQLSGVISQDDLAEIEDLRRDRATAEYGDFASSKIDPEHVLAAAEVVERVINAIASSLAALNP